MQYRKRVDEAINYLRQLPEKGEKSQDDKKPHRFIQNNAQTDYDWVVPKGDHAKKVTKIVELLTAYANDKDEKKPVSIAVFGPPGSGKSTFVEKISGAVDGIRLIKTANMTQVNHSDELADAFKTALLTTRGTTDIPLVFFDEFDTMRNGAQLGWLSWFLAPMEDGVMLSRGQEIKIGKAVFVFAGGTGETLDAFTRRAKRDTEAYRARKVPDFISRLRGTIDIGGINGHDKERIVSRALALSHSLTGSLARELDDEKRLRPMLEDGYYIHGARSLKTLVRAVKMNNGIEGMDEVIRRQHFSRGVFDGLMVGVSAGLDESDGSQAATSALTRRLLQSGATLAYAGAFFPQGTLGRIIEAAEQAPSRLIDERGAKLPIVNYLGYPACLQDRKEYSAVLESRILDTLSKDELKKLRAPTEDFFPAFPLGTERYNPAYHAAWAISQFRLRVRVVQDIGALVVCGGKDDGKSWGRMSGIAEEAMIAVALGKPVYVLGGAGGAAQAVGRLLGLGDAPPSLGACLTPNESKGVEEAFADHAADFCIPGVPDSPITLEDTRRFLFARGVATKEWCNNGLSIAENRALFACDLVSAEGIGLAVDMIVRGLGAVDSYILR